ncbi:MAG TPA: hypothetical protein VL240_03785 [Candidatus Binatia bacterium]|nr:hypothetical protein [Candidatus Binatia bacterium]
MAANPRIPPLEEGRLRSTGEERRPRLVAAGPQATRVDTFAVVSAICAVVVLVALFYYGLRAREHIRAEGHGEWAVPADGEGLQSELQFSEVQITQAPGNGRLDVFGSVRNAGNHRITGAEVQLTFRDSKGRTLASIQEPIHGTTKEADRTLADDFPIDPGESRFFQIVVNQAPAKWDHALPELKVITVSVPE